VSRSLGRIIFLILVWLFSLKYYVECIRLPEFSEKITVAVAFWLLTLFVGVELFRRIREGLRSKDLKFPPYREALPRLAKDRRAQLVASVIIYIIIIPLIGFYITSFLAFCGFSYILGTRGFIRVVIPGVIILTFIFFIFTAILNLNLPEGFLF